MQLRLRQPSVLLFVCFLGLQGCEEKFPLSQLPDPNIRPTIGDTSYIEIVPPYDGFGGPEALLIGQDQLMYVADAKNNSIVMMSLAGQQLATRPILSPRALAQDLRLDLLVAGSVVEASGDTIGAVFRIKLVASRHDLATARLDTVWKEPGRPKRRFVGIGVLPNNRYVVARSGPDNSSFVDPDGRVLLFNADDTFQTPLGDFITRAGSGITDINRPTGVAMFPNARDFLLLQETEGMAYGVLWMVYQSDPNFEGWLPRFDPSLPELRSNDFIRPGRFVLPSGAVVDGRRRDIFVADAALDSIIKFDSRGRFRSESFGFQRSGGRMLEPTGLAFFDRTLYVADRKTGRILRYRLSIDFQ